MSLPAIKTVLLPVLLIEDEPAVMAYVQAALERSGYGKNGEYVCFDVHPFRTTKVEHWLAHLSNSRRTFLRLIEKARSFGETKAKELISDRDYAALDQMVIEHLLGD